MDPLVPCPHCQGPSRPVTFSWWGGLLGPKMLAHCKCLRCGKTYNGKTGKSNDTAIAIYLIVSFVICFGLLGLLIFSGALASLLR